MSGGYIIGEGARLFFKGRRISFAAAAVFAVVLSIIGVFALGTFYLLSFKSYVEERIEVAVFLSPQANAEKLLADFLSFEGVQDGRIVSSTQALAEFRKDLGNDAELLDILKENPLPSSIRLNLAPQYRSLAKLEDLEHKLSVYKNKGVDDIWVDRNLLSRLNSLLYILLGVDFFILLIVGFSAVLLTMLATRFSILDRRRIIDLYWVMGASPRNIRAPYVVEGLFQGFFGSLISYAIVLALHLILSPLIGKFNFPYLEMAAVLSGCALLFGWIGSGLAIDSFKLKRF